LLRRADQQQPQHTHVSKLPPLIPASTSGAPYGTTGAISNAASDAIGQGWDGSASLSVGEENEYTYGYGEQEQEQEQEEPGAELDPDGVLIAAEPGSPDKPSNEVMLWPAR